MNIDDSNNTIGSTLNQNVKVGGDVKLVKFGNDYVVTHDGTKWNINKKEDVFKDIIYAKSDFICMKFTNFINQRKIITKTQLHKK